MLERNKLQVGISDKTISLHFKIRCYNQSVDILAFKIADLAVAKNITRSCQRRINYTALNNIMNTSSTLANNISISDLDNQLYKGT